MKEWYSFHLGSRFVNSPEFKESDLLKIIYPDCFVVIGDFCSFTAFLKNTNDLSIIEPLMTSFYSRMRKAIHERGGMLDKIIGDAVVAIWGIGHTKHTSLINVVDTCRELAKISLSISEEWQSHLKFLVEPKGIRIGLTRGDVIVIRRDEAYPGLSILGNPLNLAARLQSAAEPNQIVFCERVFEEIMLEKKDASLGFEFGEKFMLDAKNYGEVPAWRMKITDKNI